MKLRKFFGATSRAVLQQVRAELGPDAMIVANRATAQGIEITAVAAEAMDGLLKATTSLEMHASANVTAKVAPAQPVPASVPALAPAPAPEPEPQPAFVMAERPAAASRLTPASPPREALVSRVATRPTEVKRWEPPRFETATLVSATGSAISEKLPLRSAPPPIRAFTADEVTESEKTSSPIHLRESVFTAAVEGPVNRRVIEELASMRGLLEGQLAQIAWTDSVRRQPLRAKFMRELFASGYSAAVARELTQRLPDDYTAAQAEQWLIEVISKNLLCADATDDIVSKGGVYALTGPTGVGKTTTTAKLAARCAVHYGANQLALLTTDNYRVGAQDQLRIYAKILGVTVQTISDAGDLRQALDSLKSKHLVLIDTVGIGQRDKRVGEQAMLLAQPEVKRLLLLNATSQAETLDEVIEAYRGPIGEGPESLAGCVLTKVDEAARVGQALDVLIRHQLPLNYISNGQRVPEDLYMPNATYLAHCSFKTNTQASPYALNDDEFPLMIGNTTWLARV